MDACETPTRCAARPRKSRSPTARFFCILSECHSLKKYNFRSIKCQHLRSPESDQGGHVAVVFTEHWYDTGAQKIWLFAQVHHVRICTERLQLFREGYGLLLDVPVAEVAQVYTLEQGVSRP